MISQNKILDIIKKGLKYRKNYMMFTINKGVNFKADMRTFTWNLHQHKL